MIAEETTAPPRPPAFATLFPASPFAKACCLFGLVLILLIPLVLVSDLIRERQVRQTEVLNDFKRFWGPSQSLVTPMLAVPYMRATIADRATGSPEPVKSWIEIPASQVSVSAQLAPETRHRGLFHAVVYKADVAMSGTITIPPIDLTARAPDVLPADLLWNEALLVTQATDLRGAPAEGAAEINGHSVKQVLQTARGNCGGTVAAPIQLGGNPKVGTTLSFRTNIVLRGTQSFSLQPYGGQVDLHVNSPWSSPGFTGSALPLSYEIDHTGFHADWQYSGDSVSSEWQFSPEPSSACLINGPLSDFALGVDLLEPVPTYLMVNRAAKYGTLFLALAFVTYFIFEAVSHVRIHLVQYALLGLSVCLFGLLLISFAEPLGFTLGYALSTACVMAQASLYTLSVVGNARLAAAFAGVLGALFGFLYVVLNLETFSLLVGTLALFAALSIIMFVTRRVDWSARAAA